MNKGLEGKTLAERLSQARDEPQPVEAPEDVQNAITEAHGAEENTGTDAIVSAAKAMRDRFDTGDIQSPTAKVCLIVDDSRVIRKVSAKIAKSLGYVPIEAENGQEALARCKQQMPAIVLTDWNMPEMDGIEFVKQLRSIPTPKEPIVMFCTSNGEAKDIHEGIGAGADDYIVKPFDEAALKAKLVKLGRM